APGTFLHLRSRSMDSGSPLLDSLFVREFYLHLAESLGVSTQLPAAFHSECVARKTQCHTHAEALRLVARQVSVDLRTSRVRVGISRGHLFEIVVQVPLDVAGDPDALELAAEIYFEARLGDPLLDDWVACISVDRIARSRGLMVLNDVSAQAEHHPLEVGVDLLRQGIKNLTSELPESFFSAPDLAGDWLALEIPPSDAALHPERCLAATRVPEALKCALEGMACSSNRFTRGGEKLAWLSWVSNGSPQQRLEMRDQVGMTLMDARNS